MARELALQRATQEGLGETEGARRLAVGGEAHKGAAVGRLQGDPSIDGQGAFDDMQRNDTATFTSALPTGSSMSL